MARTRVEYKTVSVDPRELERELNSFALSDWRLVWASEPVKGHHRQLILEREVDYSV